MSAIRDRLTIEEAKRLAKGWKAEQDWALHEAAVSSHFRGATPDDLIRMWENQTNEKGKPLTRFEFEALCERWVEVFKCLPPSDDDAEAKAAAERAERAALTPDDDEMLSIKQVAKITTMSESTIKRKVQDGKFPKPLYLSERRKAWPARVVKRWLDELAMA